MYSSQMRPQGGVSGSALDLVSGMMAIGFKAWVSSGGLIGRKWVGLELLVREGPIWGILYLRIRGSEPWIEVAGRRRGMRMPRKRIASRTVAAPTAAYVRKSMRA